MQPSLSFLSNNNENTADLQDLLRFEDSITAGQAPRWARKAALAQNSVTPASPASSPSLADRFIPARSSMDLDAARFSLASSVSSSEADENNAYTSTLKRNLFDGSDTSKVLSFRNKAPLPQTSTSSSSSSASSMEVLYSQNKVQAAAAASKKNMRHISQMPVRVLDAPELVDDYYLNLLEWSSQNVLAVALRETVYLWNAASGSIAELCRTSADGDYVTAVSWIGNGDYLAVGTNHADVQLWDVRQQRQVRSMKGHTGRVGALAWNQHMLSSGSRDSNIFHHDVRLPQHHTSTLRGHSQEVCGLKWSTDGTQLASGGNDNLLHIWDASATGHNVAPRFVLDAHQAAVKALAWCPWQDHLLASGGGTADRMLRFWNTQTGQCVNSIDTQSQVCAVVWNPHERELVTSHGFSQNQLCVWKYPSLVKMAELTGHTSRVLHLGLSPDGTTVVSGAGDESLRFWKVFQEPEKPAKGAAGVYASSGMMRSMNIR